MPHKVTTVGLLDEVTATVKVAVACNAVKRTADGKLVGDMFDGEGFVRGVQRKGLNLKGSSSLQTDYLVKGCGATAMAFVDVMLKETDANFIMVDKRDAPGGHWNDAYSFVRLHQASSFYGVASRALGNERIDSTGVNKGMLELASGIEVANYFHQHMRETFLPTGRVSFYPMSEIVGEPGSGSYMIRSLLSDAIYKVHVRKRLVDATITQAFIPLTHSGRYKPSALESAVELRLGEKRAGRLEDVIGTTQLLDLTLQCLELFTFACGQAFALPVVNFVAFDPVVQCLRHATDLRCYGFNGCP